jgi:hypothetical protein
VPARGLVLAALLALALGLAACGGSSSPSGGAGGTKTIPGAQAGGAGGSGPTGAAGKGGSATAIASRPTFIRNADRVCRRAHSQLGQLGRQARALIVDSARHRQLSSPHYYDGVAHFTQSSANVAARAVVDLRALARPRDRRVETFLSLAESQVRVLALEAAALRHRDNRAVGQLNAQLVSTGRHEQRLARTYGFRVCGG